MSHIFISYSRDNEEYVLQLIEQLISEGFETWRDRDIPPGDNWIELIFEKIKQCSAMIVVMSESSSQSGWVQREIIVAQENSVPIFPLLLSGRRFDLLADLQYEDGTSGLIPSLRFFDSLDQTSQIKPVRKGNHLYSHAHRSADIKILTKLWVQMEDIGAFLRDFNYRSYYSESIESINQYCSMRKHPKNRFVHSTLEMNCKKFDEMSEHLQRLLESWFARYERKQPELYRLHEDYFATRPKVSPHSPDVIKERYWEKTEYLRTVCTVLLDTYTKLVYCIKEIFPEFDLSTPSSE